MLNVIESKVINLKNPDLNGESFSLFFTLFESITKNGKVYDIECHTEKTSDLYEGVTDNPEKARDIFEKIVKGAVMPQHLICIIDEMLD